MSGTPSLAFRAVLSLLLMVGFYALAALLGLFMLAVLYLLVSSRSFGFFQIKIGIIVIVGLIALVAAVIPRRAPFKAPGPLLRPEEQPKLFAFLHKIAEASAYPMPSQVYLLPEVNAFVMQKGGFMGLGGTKVLGVGLPLLQTMSQAQLASVIAHEFGHFVAGDARLGALVYQARQALIRTIQHLAHVRSYFGLPFQWYAMLFFRVSHGVSRRQELEADSHAARIAGKSAATQALQNVATHSIAYNVFLGEDFIPALRRSFLPSLSNGYQQFVQHKMDESIRNQWLEEVLASEQKDPYDTHPPLKERLSALAMGPENSPLLSFSEEPALSLLRDSESLNADMVALGFDLPVAGLKSLDWDEAGEKVHGVAMQETFKPLASALHDLDFNSWASLKSSPYDLTTRLMSVHRVPQEAAEYQAFLEWLLPIWLAQYAHSHGWTFRGAPGQKLTLNRGDESLDYFQLALDYLNQKISEDEWLKLGERITRPI